MTSVRFIYATNGEIQDYWLTIDNKPVMLNNGVSTLKLEAGEHTLVWWLKGEPQSGFSIIGLKQDDTDVVKVKKSKIGQGSQFAIGYKRFHV